MRLIRTHPGFVLTVVLSLALGIGANTAIFSVVHGVLIQPLPYPRADAVVGIYHRLTISEAGIPTNLLSVVAIVSNL